MQASKKVYKYNHIDTFSLPLSDEAKKKKLPFAREISRQEHNAKFFAARSGRSFTHLEALERNTGWGMNPEHWAKSLAQRERIIAQTEQLADLLEAAGVEARNRKSTMYSISAITEVVTELTPFRSINFLPSVAARERRPLLNALQLFMQRNPAVNQYARYGVVTSGQLVEEFGDLRGTIQELSRAISKWASEIRTRYGIDVLFRGTEFTRKTVEERHEEAEKAGRKSPFSVDAYPDREQVLYNVHANILYHPTRKLAAEGNGSWQEFLEFSHRFLVRHWADCGTVDKLEEIIKYVAKPADLLEGEKPLDQNSAQWLYEQTFRVNFVSPMSKFRKFLNALERTNSKVIVVRGRKDCSHNASGLAVVSRGKKRTNTDADEQTEQAENNADVDRISSSMVGQNKLITVTVPSRGHTPWAEPHFLVMGYDPNPISERSKDRLFDMKVEMRAFRDMWDAAQAPDPQLALEIAKSVKNDGMAAENVVPIGKVSETRYKVHTSSLSVQDNAQDEPQSKSEGLRLVKTDRVEPDIQPKIHKPTSDFEILDRALSESFPQASRLADSFEHLCPF